MAEQYEKKELRQHIYDTPDTYVGGIDVINEVLPIKESDKIVFKEIEYIVEQDQDLELTEKGFVYLIRNEDI